MRRREDKEQKHSVPRSGAKDYDFWYGAFSLTKCYLARAVNGHWSYITARY